MSRIRTLDCRRSTGQPCIACARYFTGIKDKKAEFAAHEEPDFAAMMDCGGCPELVSPRVKMLTDTAKEMGRPNEVLHLGACVKSERNTRLFSAGFRRVERIARKQFRNSGGSGYPFKSTQAARG